jgi:hypothetical protein
MANLLRAAMLRRLIIDPSITAEARAALLGELEAIEPGSTTNSEL